MLASQSPLSGARSRHGCPRASLAEVRNGLATPGKLEHRHRQRLQELAARLARVRELGGEYTGIELSEYAAAAMDRRAATV